MNGRLILEDGSVFYGQMMYGNGHGIGEVVFNTGMTGYQEILTDPSYCGQIVTLTYPLIGNYGVAAAFDQAQKPFIRGFIVSELCDYPNNWRSEGNIADYLTRHGIPCLYGVDTRAVTRKIRARGAMKGIIVPEGTADESVKKQLNLPLQSDVVMEVTTEKIYRLPNNGPRIAVLDFGIKKNILNSFSRAGCDLTVFPADAGARDVLELNPDGIFLSNGPGDPKNVPYAINTIKELIGRKPIFGICLGHQLLALALGGNTYKLKFGHRGSNHPVKDLRTGRVAITSQNHGYAVDENSLAGIGITVTHRAVNDGTVEGMKHTSLPIFSVQYHPEAAPGPDDNAYLFDEFITLLNGGK